ncbi:MAG: T9SS type A sorting domain-containing protein, partial [Tannerella sp.]|nr:T9SS type A sorting domain-containing protein [Tannerella sp.]
PELPAHQYLGFLMVFGEDGDNLTFKVYDHAADREYTASNVVSFASDAIHGTLENPYQIRSISTGNEAVGAGELSVYPNPVEDKLMIRNYELSNVEKVTITDLTGRVLYSSSTIINDYIDVSSYSSGVYIIQFTTADGVVTRKFVKK